MTWTWEIYETKTGVFRAEVNVSTCNWESKLTGQGRGTHSIPLFGTDQTSAWWRESAKGNKYTIVQRWGSHIAYAGVLAVPEYDRDTKTLKVDSVELRAAYMDARMLYGVFSYVPGDVALDVVAKSRSGAAREVLQRATTAYWGAFWVLPIDLPDDGSGSFSATWMMEERLTLEDHLSQIEADGCEIFFRPYLDDDGKLRWHTHVQSQVSIGDPTELAATGDSTPLHALKVRRDYTRELTGILGFGKGGTDAPAYGFSPGDGADEISVRDTWVNFPDLDGSRLEAATEALNYLGYPIEQWSFGVSVYPGGPGDFAPGHLVNLTISGDPFITDGTHELRVIATRGDAGTMVSLEVQDA